MNIFRLKDISKSIYEHLIILMLCATAVWTWLFIGVLSSVCAQVWCSGQFDCVVRFLCTNTPIGTFGWRRPPASRDRSAINSPNNTLGGYHSESVEPDDERELRHCARRPTTMTLSMWSSECVCWCWCGCLVVLDLRKESF